MTARHSTTIALTEHLQSWIDGLVNAGEYQNASEVVRDALQTLKEQRETDATTLAEIRDRIRRGAVQADRREYAAGSGQDAVRRAFGTALKRTDA